MGVLLGLTLLLASVVPVAAMTFRGTGFYARFGPSATTDPRGLVIVDRTQGSHPRLTARVVGLFNYVDINIVGRSIGCGGKPSTTSRVFGVHAAADGNGAVSYDAALSSAIVFEKVKSVWIDWGDGSACALSFNFEEIRVATGDVNGDGALGLVKTGAGTMTLLLERRPNDKARLSIVFNGLNGNDTYRIRLVNNKCGTPPTASYVSWTLQDVLISGFKSKTVPLSQGHLDKIRSVRVTNLSNGNTWCGPVSVLVALLIP
jgi:hypothetical protein